METNMPLVLVGRPYSADSVSYVDIDNINAAHNAVRHLTRLKYERIAMISGPEKNITSIDRQEGYRRALAERNLHSDDSLLARGDFTELSGYYAMKQLIPARPQAVFAASDIMAIGAMRAAREAGLRIPEDVAFVGFDDLPLPAQPGPQLTTVRQPVQKFGSTAVEILIDVIENGIEPPRRIIMSTELIVRESCGASGR
jgi:LacI family transcriptional regulator